MRRADRSARTAAAARETTPREDPWVPAILVKTQASAHRKSQRSYRNVGDFFKTTSLSSEAPELDAPDGVVASFLEDQMRALARRPDVLTKIDEVDGAPDRARRFDRLVGRERRVAMKVRGRIAEYGVTQRQKPIDIPLFDIALLRVDINREVEEIRHERRHRASRTPTAGLQHVEPFDDHHVGLTHLEEFAGHD